MASYKVSGLLTTGEASSDDLLYLSDTTDGGVSYASKSISVGNFLNGYATESYVTSALDALVNGAPAALDTLKELSDALGADSNFSTTITNLINGNEIHVDNMATLTGVAKDSTNLGTFTGSTISDSVDIKTALQDLETTVETKGDATALNAVTSDANDLVALSGLAAGSVDLGSFTGSTIVDASNIKAALQLLETALEAEAASRSAADITLQGNIDAETTARTNAVSDVEDDVDNLETLTGMGTGATTLGTFSGSTINDNTSVKQALQALESAQESEASTRASADTTLQSNIDTEAAARIAAVSDEATARQAADALLLPLAGGTMSGAINMGTAAGSAWDQSQVWSNSLASDNTALAPLTNAFDGNTDTAAGTDSNGTLTFTPSITVPANSTIEMSGSGGAPGAASEMLVTVDGVESTIDGSGFYPVAYNNGTTITTITVKRKNTSNSAELRGIKINGKLLVDSSVVDPLAGPSPTIIGVDGTASFSGLISASTAPTDDAHLVNKLYADSLVAGVDLSGIATNAAAISAETTARTNADTTLQSNIDAEAASRVAADNTLTTNLAQEVTDRTAAVSAEASARTSADTTLQSNIDAEETARIAADALLLPLAGGTMSGAIQMGAGAAPVAYVPNAVYYGTAGVIGGFVPEGVFATDHFASANRLVSRCNDNGLSFSALTINSTLRVYVEAESGQLLLNKTHDSGWTATNPAAWVDVTLPSTPFVLTDLGIHNGDASHSFAISAIEVDGVVVDTTYTVSGGSTATSTIGVDGTASFSGLVSASTAPTADEHLTNKLYVDSKAATNAAAIEAVVGGAPELLNTLNELAQAISDDENFSTTVTNQIAAETTARQNSDVTLQSNIDSEAAARAGADTTLQSNIDAEAAARIAADNTLTTNLATEVSDRQAAVSAEETARQAADALLLPLAGGTMSGAINLGTTTETSLWTGDTTTNPIFNGSGGNGLVTLRYENESTSFPALVAESSILIGVRNHTGAVNLTVNEEFVVQLPASGLRPFDVSPYITFPFTLTSVGIGSGGGETGIYYIVIDGVAVGPGYEVSVPASGATLGVDGTASFSGLISAAAVPTADAHLTNKLYVDTQVASNAAAIEAVVGGAPELLNTLNELAEAINDDENFSATITGQIAAETTARTNADITLQSNIDAEAAARIAADNTLTTNLATEVSDRTTAVSNEAVARSNADTTLQNNIDAEAAARIAADSTLTTNLATEVSDRQAAVTAEANARTSADTTLQTNIDAEATARIAADALLLPLAGGTMSGAIEFGATAASGTSGSVEFDGVDDYLSVAGPGTLAADSNWSMEAWVYPTGDSSGTYRIMGANESTHGSEYFHMRVRNGAWEFFTQAQSSGGVGTVSFNQWAHVALTKEGTTVRAFVDGVKVWEVVDASADQISTLVIGYGYGSEYFKGYISNARFVNGSSVYTADFTVPTENLEAIASTELLCCQSSESATEEATGKTLTAFGSIAASTENPGLSGATSSLATIGVDGTASFSGLISAATAPTADVHLTNKLYVDNKAATNAAAIEALTNGAPDLLNTLNELANAINDDENFSTTVTNQIAAETTARQNSDVTLQSNIDSEAAARAGADATLQANIDAEETARIAGDANLQTAITNLTNGAVASNTADIATETAARQAADALLLPLAGGTMSGAIELGSISTGTVWSAGSITGATLSGYGIENVFNGTAVDGGPFANNGTLWGLSPTGPGATVTFTLTNPIPLTATSTVELIAYHQTNDHPQGIHSEGSITFTTSNGSVDVTPNLTPSPLNFLSTTVINDAYAQFGDQITAITLVSKGGDWTLLGGITVDGVRLIDGTGATTSAATIGVDGTASFSGLISASTAPTADAHLVNKLYADNLVAGVDLTGIATNAAAIAAETTARTNADTALSGRLDTLEADPTTQTLLTAETTSRTSADSALSGRLDVLEADPTTATALSTEEAARIAADNTLTANLNQEIADRSAAVTAEATARANAILALTNGAVAANTAAISAEETARIAADAAEASARTAAISAEENARIAADNTHTANIATNATAIADETAARVTAVSGLDAAYKAADATITANVTTNTTNITANTTAISSEEAARIAADNTKVAIGDSVNVQLVGNTTADSVPVDGTGADNYLFLVIDKATGALKSIEKSFLETE